MFACMPCKTACLRGIYNACISMFVLSLSTVVLSIGNSI